MLKIPPEYRFSRRKAYKATPVLTTVKHFRRSPNHVSHSVWMPGHSLSFRCPRLRQNHRLLDTQRLLHHLLKIRGKYIRCASHRKSTQINNFNKEYEIQQSRFYHSGFLYGNKLKYEKKIYRPLFTIKYVYYINV